jgi:hypothetical protein
LFVNDIITIESEIKTIKSKSKEIRIYISLYQFLFWKNFEHSVLNSSKVVTIIPPMVKLAISKPVNATSFITKS